MTCKEIAQMMGKPQEYNGSREFGYIESPIVKGQYLIKRPLGAMKKLTGLSPKEYIDLLVENGGYIIIENRNVVRFKTIEEAQKVVEILNSLIVLQEMIK